MSSVNYDRFKSSLARLQERYNFHLKHQHNATFEQDITESIKESCMQRFEVCFDMTHKHLKKYLKAQGHAKVPESPNPIFRLAHQDNLIDAEVWIAFNQKRCDTNHEYSSEKVASVLEIIPDFIHAAIDLYERLSGEPWQK